MEETQCNLCGNPMNEFDTQNDFTIHKKVGYGSAYDMDEVRLRFCCKCFDSLVWRCAVSPVCGSYNCADGEG